MCAVLTLAVTFVLFVGAEMVHRVLGKTGIRILERIMGLILTVMAVQFVIDGIKKAFFPL
jgi:multiple antibiotic resistance protein